MKAASLNFISFSFLFLSSIISNAQMVGTEAYIQGIYVELGISGAGGNEGANTGSAPVPVGMHNRPFSGLFGYVANPQMNGWATFDGDFFTPGSPENGWGFEIGATSTINGNNNSSSMGGTVIPGAITGWSHTGMLTTVDWDGNDVSGSLHFHIKYELGDSALYYTTTVSVTNTSSGPINNIYYYHNFDPDNNESVGFDFTTTNTIVSQHMPGTSSVAHVSATSTVPSSQPMSYISLMAIDTGGWRASYGGFSNRDASDLYMGVGFVQTVGSVNFADEAISLAHLTPTLAVGATSTFKFATLFTPSAAPCGGSGSGVSITSASGVCVSGAPLNLTAMPAGGVFSGPGVSASTFDPSVTGAGAFTISYTYSDTSGCESTVAQNISVVDTVSLVVPSGSICESAPAITLTGGTPSGGTYSGAGVSGTSFDPFVAGDGAIPIFYTDIAGCDTDVDTIFVSPAANVTFSALPGVCDNGPSLTLTGGSPAGGIYSGPGVVSGTYFYPFVVGPGTYTITYDYDDGSGCPGSATQTIIVYACTGVNEVNANSLVSVYPNPVEDEVTFTLSGGLNGKNIEFKLYDLLGKEVFVMESIATPSFGFRKNDLNTGMYFYRISSVEGKIGEGKIIIR
jgi:hypothetical protein